MKKYISVKTVSVITAVTLAVCALTGCGREVSDKDEQGRTIISIGNYPMKEGKSKETWDAKWQKFETDNEYDSAPIQKRPSKYIAHFPCRFTI